ncbi:MAG TPA: hypothetical protein DEG96_09860 [Candidatus Atribacteria bacterium]|nr:hypothetical protein [Candidatus Atribacteria bacterium]
MENKISDINDLVLFLAATAMKPLLNDEVWQCYGYAKRPKHGNVWNRIFPKMFELENFILKEILIMGLIDILNGIKKSEEESDTKLLLSIGVIDQFLSTTKHMFPSDSFMENLFSAYASYLKSEKSKIHVPVILKAKDVLNKKDFAKFMVGTIKLLAIEHADDYLLKSDYIKSVIEKSAKENKLKISIPDEMYKKYVPLIEEKILNTALKI